MKKFVVREIVRWHAIFKAVAPFMPRWLVGFLRGLKRTLTANRVYRKFRRRPQADRRRPASEVERLFDDDFYRYLTRSSENRQQLLKHYRRFGWQSGLDPSPHFDVGFYLAQATAKKVAVLGDPFEHYLGEGWKLGLDPNPLFDSTWYSKFVGLGATCPLTHYLDIGRWSGSPTSPALEKALLPFVRSSSEPADAVTAIPYPDPCFRLVTFDFWDTLVLRTRPADSAKLATARRIAIELGVDLSAVELMSRRVRTEAEYARASEHEEYEISDVISSLVASLSSDLPEGLVTRLIEAEVADECRNTRLHPETTRMLEELRVLDGGPEIAILSDFYMKGSELRTILESHGVNCEGLRFYSSCEHSASKRLGDLYPLVHRDFDVSPEQHLHIGDNQHSDVDMAIRSGARALLVSVARDFPGPGQLSSAWFASMPFDEGCSRVGSLLAGDSKRSLLEKRAVFAGSRNSFLPVALIFAASQRANERNLDHVFYVSREGAFLSELHRHIRDEHPELNFPHPVHLEVSRRSTFGASMTDIDGPNLDRLWSQYPNQSTRGLLHSLGIDPTFFDEDLRRYGLALDETIIDIRTNARVREFLADGDVERRLLTTLNRNRECLATYLVNRGLSSDRALVVDLGWRGTIQDNLAHVLNETHFHGVYLGLFPYLNKQAKNVTKEGLAFDGNLGGSFDHVSPPAALESPLTPDLPSAVGYRRRDDGRVVVLTEAEAGRANHLITSFQDGVRAALPFLVDHFVSNGYDFECLAVAAETAVKRYFIDPDPGVADIWFGSSHDDTFGAMNKTPFEKRFDPSVIFRAKGDLREIVPAIDSGWAMGYMQWLPAQASALLFTLRSR